MEDENIRSSASPAASPPLGFRGSLQRRDSEKNEKTSQHQQQQKKKNSPCAMVSSIPTLEAAAPPPHGFGDSLQHDSFLSPQRQRSPKHSESPIVSRKRFNLFI